MPARSDKYENTVGKCKSRNRMIEGVDKESEKSHFLKNST